VERGRRGSGEGVVELERLWKVKGGKVKISGMSQPTLALGRQTSDCHAGQDELICLELLPVLLDRLLRERLVYSGS
jgi:hypothetical protein